mmetsp:Transcript_16622/g.40011  ORF Transcript_16622/g.40011 Transcript_16622/m.40011 type:complete len:208 (+) Transcript_16622:196-819(+)
MFLLPPHLLHQPAQLSGRRGSSGIRHLLHQPAQLSGRRGSSGIRHPVSRTLVCPAEARRGLRALRRVIASLALLQAPIREAVASRAASRAAKVPRTAPAAATVAPPLPKRFRPPTSSTSSRMLPTTERVDGFAAGTKRCARASQGTAATAWTWLGSFRWLSRPWTWGSPLRSCWWTVRRLVGFTVAETARLLVRTGTLRALRSRARG